MLWEANAAIPSAGVKIGRGLIRKTGYRIPILRDEADGRLLECLARHPPLGGNENHAPVAKVHQGEINLTVHRRFITNQRTRYPLIRGEHVTPLRVIHPSPGRERLDWVAPAFLEHRAEKANPPRNACESSENSSERRRGTPWEASRIVLGRVVNMGTDRRLKAAPVSEGAFLGDMTNFIVQPSVSVPYLLGLLNSRLLNCRIKLTSTNNYISAAEVEALPVPRPSVSALAANVSRHVQEVLAELAGGQGFSVRGYVKVLADADVTQAHCLDVIPAMIEWLVGELQTCISQEATGSCRNFWNLLDALVLLLYGVEFYAPALDGETPKR
jgi:hypothetical protein